MEMISTLRNNGLKGKVVVVASQRSGKCIPSELVQTFLAEESLVYAADTHREILKIVEAETEQYLEQKITTYPLDFNDPGAVDEFVRGNKGKRRAHRCFGNRIWITRICFAS